MVVISYAHPVPRRGGSHKYPFSELKPGGSFFVPGRYPKNVAYQSYLFRQVMRKKNPDAVLPVFTSRTVTEDGVKGVRCWRVS